ncbi:hypothetical protein HHI36_013823 [Cryptolaemus montrouzieri]
MLGWPSPTYPYLLQSTSVIPISMNQSAMIAGFFMLGAILTTPLSCRYHLGPKYGIWIGMALMTIGWIIMWYSEDVIGLLCSRFTVGLGSGYGLGQVKGYISDLCEPQLAQFLNKQLNFYGLFGILVTFMAGPFLNFRKFPYVPVITCLIVLLVIMFLPCTPKDFVKRNKMDEAATLLDYLRGKRDHSNELKKIQNELIDKKINFFSLLKIANLRRKFLKFILLVFLQQFSGGPTTIVYCQLIFTMSDCPYPEYCAILYAVTFFISNIYGTFYASKLNKKFVLIFSIVTTAFMLISQIAVLYFEINKKYWSFTSLIVMLLFITFYCVGVGNTAIAYVPEWFPEQYKVGMVNTFSISFYAFAIIATKVFQVLITAYPLYIGFCLFLFCDLVNLIFVIIFVKKKSSEFDNYKQTNSVYFWNSKRGNEIEKHINNR